MVERRRGSDEIEAKLDEIAKKLDDHLRDADIKFVAFERAFPDGPEAHRLAHEAMINAANAQEKFWSDLRLDMAKGGVRAVILVVIGLIVAGLSAKIVSAVQAVMAVGSVK